MSYISAHYHIIFRTKRSERTIVESEERRVYQYMYELLKDRKCFVHRIGGMPDHIHILLDIPHTTPVSDLLRDLKANTSKWIRENRVLPMWDGWGDGYAAFTYCKEKVEVVKHYIMNQKEHHKTVSARDEFIAFLQEEGIPYDERYI